MGEGAREGVQGEKVGLFLSSLHSAVLVVTADEAAAVPERSERQGNERRGKKRKKKENRSRKMTLCSGFDLKAC